MAPRARAAPGRKNKPRTTGRKTNRNRKSLNSILVARDRTLDQVLDIATQKRGGRMRRVGPGARHGRHGVSPEGVAVERQPATRREPARARGLGGGIGMTRHMGG